jgi:hypothetical protein
MGKRGMHLGYWWESQMEITIRKTKTWLDNIDMNYNWH